MRRNTVNIGKEGESLAESYLLERGYKIVERNKRIHRVEIDIIAEHEDTIVFIEVKTRKDDKLGSGIESVDLQKQKRLAYAASIYLSDIRKDWPCRFDVISILLHEDSAVNQIVHMQDAFRPL